MSKKNNVWKFEYCEIKYSEAYSDEFYQEFINNFQKNTKKRLFYKFIKRAFDIFASLFALIVLSPLLLGIAIAIKIDSKGPVLFKQSRIGRKKKVFTIYKFRSMCLDAPHDKDTEGFLDPNKYYTKVGRFLRKTSFDEFPQFINILKGDMSFIGYRPVLVSDGASKQCNELRDALGVFEMRPGISGYAQVIGRDDVYHKNKALMDAYYVKNASILMDIKLIFGTVKVVLSRDGNVS